MTTIGIEELDRLERVARDAFGSAEGGGEWRTQDDGEEQGVVRHQDDATWIAVTGASGYAAPVARAEHIATFNPATVLRLIAALRAKAGA